MSTRNLEILLHFGLENQGLDTKRDQRIQIQKEMGKRGQIRGTEREIKRNSLKKTSRGGKGKLREKIYKRMRNLPPPRSYELDIPRFSFSSLFFRFLRQIKNNHPSGHGFSTILDHTRLYSTNRPSFLSTILDHTRPFSTILDHTRPYSTILDHTRPYSTNRPNFLSTISTILDHNRPQL